VLWSYECNYTARLLLYPGSIMDAPS
jgi:hypothetical protein